MAANESWELRVLYPQFCSCWWPILAVITRPPLALTVYNVESRVWRQSLLSLLWILRTRAYLSSASEESLPMLISMAASVQKEYIHVSGLAVLFPVDEPFEAWFRKSPDYPFYLVIEMFHSLHLEILAITLPSAIAQSQLQQCLLGTLASATSVHPPIVPGRGRRPIQSQQSHWWNAWHLLEWVNSSSLHLYFPRLLNGQLHWYSRWRFDKSIPRHFNPQLRVRSNLGRSLLLYNEDGWPVN